MFLGREMQGFGIFANGGLCGLVSDDKRGCGFFLSEANFGSQGASFGPRAFLGGPRRKRAPHHDAAHEVGALTSATADPVFTTALLGLGRFIWRTNLSGSTSGEKKKKKRKKKKNAGCRSSYPPLFSHPLQFTNVSN